MEIQIKNEGRGTGRRKIKINRKTEGREEER